MFKKVFILSLFISSVYGEGLLCPSVGEIRSGTFHAWQPLNANSNAMATPKQIEKFVRRTSHFYQAEYFDDGLFNAHCYYADFQEVYLAKYLPVKEFHNKNWHFSGGRWSCHSSSVEECLYG